MRVDLAWLGVAAAFRGVSRALGSPKVRRSYLALALSLLTATMILYLAGGFGVLHHSSEVSSDFLKIALRVTGFLIVLVASPLLALFIVNLLVPFTAERVFLAGLSVASQEMADELSVLPGLSFTTSLKIGLRRMLRFLFLSILVFFLAFVPVIGSLLAPPAQFLLTARVLGGELIDPFMSRRSMPREVQRAYMDQHRSALLGFAAPFVLLLTIPIIGPLFFGLAQAAAGTLIVDVLEVRDADNTPENGSDSADSGGSAPHPLS